MFYHFLLEEKNAAELGMVKFTCFNKGSVVASETLAGTCSGQSFEHVEFRLLVFNRYTEDPGRY
jgi:hypothetical protein